MAQELFPPGATEHRLPHEWCQLGCDICCKFNNVMGGLNAASNFKDWIENAHACLDAGYDPETCADAANFCLLQQSIPWDVFGQLGSWVSALELDQLFRTNCGDGTCFQCCFAGGNCHSSFIGFPVINCNTNYGADASAAGLTHVLSGNPGDPCLFTPQTCSHLPVCNLHLSPAQIQQINNDPNHIMKSEGARENRRRWFATKTGDIWLNFLNKQGNSDTSALSGQDNNLYAYRPHHLHDFITGRGGIGWRKKLESAGPDWTQTIFAAMNDDSTAAASVPSRLRAVYQAGIMRVLASIPNLAARLDQVESVIWDSVSIQNYLAAVPDPDAEILKYAHPLTLTILQTLSKPPFKVLQDYRLLSVPLPGEEMSPNLYNGAELGIAPVVKLESQIVNGAGVILTASVGDLDDLNEIVPVIVVWGDGRIEKYTVSPDNPVLIAGHEYPAAGSYQAYVIAQNVSGLYGVTGTVVKTTSDSGTPGQNHLAVSRIYVNDVKIKAGTFLGYPLDISFQLGGIDKQGRKNRFGKMTTVNLDSNPASTVNVGHVAGDVPMDFELEKLTLEFEFSYKNGGDMWQNLSQNNSWWSTSGFSLQVWDPARNEFKSIDVPITADMITLLDIQNFQDDSTGNRYAYDAPIFDPAGQLIVPFRYTSGAIKIKGAEIDIPGTVFSNPGILPMNSSAWSGDANQWKEAKPGFYEAAETPSSVSAQKSNPFEVRCFPNPFSEGVYISFTLKKPEHVALDVFDGMGRKIETLVNTTLSSGSYQFDFKPNPSNSHIYLLRVTADGKSAVKPLIRTR